MGEDHDDDPRQRPGHLGRGAGRGPGEAHWRRNLAVCVFGSFTTLVAMTLLLPFLPLYVEELGVEDRAAIVQWSGVAFGATFFSAALVAPLWGRLADLYGRKLMLIRASLGMAVAMSLIGLAENVWQLVALRLLAGFLGGYASGSTVLVATQTPKARSAWALGMLGLRHHGGQPRRAAGRRGAAAADRHPGDVLRRRRGDLRGLPGDAGPDPRGAAPAEIRSRRRRLRQHPRQAPGPRHAGDRHAPDAGGDVGRADHHRLRRRADARSRPASP